MAFRDWLSRLTGLLSKTDTTASNRPDGGTSCYRPLRKKQRTEGEQQAPEAAQGNAPVTYAHTGFTGMNPPVQDPYGPQGGMNQPGMAGRQPLNNISYMPGVYAPDAGNTYTHVEHLMAITSLRGCYEAIECMKNGETLIITMDAIGQDSESIRCQDMLAGAAFTLGCTVRMIQAGSVVVIAPAGVKILPEVRRRAWADPMAMPYGMPANRPPQEQPPVRERRSSQNAVGWEQASGEAYRSYNPYTGNVPAAAGDYSGYGGYGY